MNELDKIKETFSNIYDKNLWGNGSGAGSHPDVVNDYVRVLEDTIKTYNIKTVLDYGCGDWQFSQHINWSKLVDSYLGVDIVDNLIQHHNQTYSTNIIKFQTVDTDWKMPQVDLIICKDVLQHLSNNTVKELLDRFEKSSKYMILTNDASTAYCPELVDCDNGMWRPLNLNCAPWNKFSIILLQWYSQPAHNIIKDTLLIQNSNKTN